MRQTIDFPAGRQNSRFQTNAYDGEWTRMVWGRDPGNPQGLGVVLRRGREPAPAAIPAGSPCIGPIRCCCATTWFMGSLGDHLAPRHPEPRGRQSLMFGFRYCGAAEVDGHPCIEVRGDNAPFNQNNNALVLYLAADRNDIPIRMEQYGTFGRNRLAPMMIGSCGGFREIAPGRWYPSQLTEFGFDIVAHVTQGRILLNWRRDTTIESVAPARGLDDAVFRDVVAPAGAQVQVQDEDSQYIGGFQQAEVGIVSLTLKDYLKLAAEAPSNPWQKQARGQARDAVVGKPAPEFPRGATWLGGGPLTWEDLRGHVVLLGFWAEWSDASRDELARLRRLRRDGLTIIAVHPPGSQLADIKKAIDAQGVDFPICIDAQGPGDSDAWGQLSSRFAVKSVPDAAVVNREGRIVARGPLQDVLDRTRVLVRSGR